jgi:taurine--2-oxoglutarate transaminase
MSNQKRKLTQAEKQDSKHTLGTWTRQQDFDPTEIVGTEEFSFITADDNKLLDFSSQLVCVNHGYDEQSIKNAVTEAMDEIPYSQPSYSNKYRGELAEKIAEITPGSLNRTFFSTSGTEANEAAFKIARSYTGREKIMSRYRSYHGATAASLSASGDPRRTAVSSAIQPGVPGMVKAPDPYAYGSTLTPEQSLEYIDEQLELEGGSVAAVLVEPLVGANGVLTPPDDYLPKLQKIAHKHGALLICDEVMTGFGRTGEWFASDLYGAEPDIITAAKGITGAYQPLAGTIVSEEIAEHFEETLLNHGHTYTGHPVACAAGSAAIDAYRENDLITNAREVGAYLREELDELVDRHPSAGERRGVGLHQGVELTQNTEHRVPFEKREDKISNRTTVVDEVGQRARDNGVYFYTSMNTIIITPPLGINRGHVDRAIEALDNALEHSDSKVIS